MRIHIAKIILFDLYVFIGVERRGSKKIENVLHEFRE